AAAAAGRDELDPECVVGLVVRGDVGPAQRIQAALLRARRRRGEPRQLEDHPRATVQLAHADRQGRPFGCHLDLGTGNYVGFTGNGELLAVAADNDRRLRRSGCAAASTTTAETAAAAAAETAAARGAGTARTTGHCAGAGGTASCGRCARTGTASSGG